MNKDILNGFKKIAEEGIEIKLTPEEEEKVKTIMEIVRKAKDPENWKHIIFK